MTRNIFIIVCVLLFIAGQGLMLLNSSSLLAGGALAAASVIAAVAAFFRLEKPLLKWCGDNLGVIALASACLSPFLMKHHFPVALGFLFASAVLFLIFKKNASLVFEVSGLAEIKKEGIKPWEPYFFAALLIAAYFTRLHLLGDIPAGAVEHEGRIALDVASYLKNSALFIPYLSDHHANWSSLLFYQGMTCADLFGWNSASYRFAPAFYGFLSVIALYFTARKITSPGAAAVVSLLYTGCQLHIGVSRQLFPGSLLFLPAVLALGFFIDGMRGGKWVYFALSGAAAGLSLHGYFSGRVAPFAFAAWVIWLLVVNRRNRISAPCLVALTAGFLLVASPVLYFAVKDPKMYSAYIDNMSPYHGGLFSNIQHGIMAIYGNMQVNLPVFFFNGGIDYSLHMPFQPFVDPLTRALFIGGVAALLLSFWKPVPSYLLAFLVAGFLPSLLANTELVGRRSLMALPAIFLIAAVPVEYFFTFLNSRKEKVTGGVLLGLSLAAAAVFSAAGINGFFNGYAKSAGTRVPYSYNVYLAIKEARQHPLAPAFINKQVESTLMSETMMVDFARAPKEYTSENILFNQDSGAGELYFLPPYLENALPAIREMYPGAVVKVYSEENIDDPYYTNGIYDNMPWAKYIDPFNKYLFLISVYVPEKDIRDFHVSLASLDSRGARVKVFDPGFGRENSGRQFNLGGIFVLDDKGGYARFSMKWPGWKIYVDAKQEAWQSDVRLDGGLHFFTLAGKVPQPAEGAMPFEIESNGRELVKSSCAGAFPGPTGLKLGVWKGLKSWYKGRPEAVKLVPFAAKRFYGDEGAGLPCSAALEGYIKVPESGEYEFYTVPFTGVRMYIDNRNVYDNTAFTNPADARPVPVNLKAGEKAPFKAEMLVPPDRLGICTFVVYYRKAPDREGKIAPFKWFSPY